MTEGRPRPNRVRVKLHEANCAPEYVQAYLADEMDEYLDMLRAESAPAPTPAKDAWECAVKIAPIYCYPADYPGIDKAAAEIERYVESRIAEEREAKTVPMEMLFRIADLNVIGNTVSQTEDMLKEIASRYSIDVED